MSKAGFFLNSRCNGKADTLVATDYKDPQAVVYGVDAYNQSASVEVTKALNSAATDSDHVPSVCYSQDAYDKYAETDKGASLKASGGNYGGGYREYSNTVGSLCARDYKGVSNQYVNEGKVIVQQRD